MNGAVVWYWLGNLVVLSTLLALAWRVVLGPHLSRLIETRVVDPLAKVVVATTKNGGHNDPATLRDDLHVIKSHLAEQDAHLARQDEEHAALRRDVQGVADENAQHWREHRIYSNASQAVQDARLDALEAWIKAKGAGS